MHAFFGGACMFFWGACMLFSGGMRAFSGGDVRAFFCRIRSMSGGTYPTGMHSC